jgi:hypothetical protein
MEIEKYKYLSVHVIRARNKPSRARLGSVPDRARLGSARPFHSARLDGGSRAGSAHKPHPDII